MALTKGRSGGKKRGRTQVPRVLAPSRPLGGPAGFAGAVPVAARPVVGGHAPVRPAAARLAGPTRPAGARKPARQGGLPKVARIAFLVVFVYLFAGFVFQEFEVFKLARQVRALEDQAASLEAENQRLVEEIQYSQTPEYVERVAREELGLIWPNEVLYAPTAPSSDTGGGSDATGP